MNPLRWWAVMVLAVAVLAGIPGGTQGRTPVHPEIEPQAMSVIERVTKVPAEVGRFCMTVDIGYDLVQDSGQKIKFGETRTILVLRPHDIRIETVDRDGLRRGFTSDGDELTVFNVDDKVYATSAEVGTIDEIIDYVVNVFDKTWRLPDARKVQ